MQLAFSEVFLTLALYEDAHAQSAGKVLLNFAVRRRGGEKIVENCRIVARNCDGVSPKKQKLPVLQSGVSHSEPRRHRFQFGDFRFDWTDVRGEMDFSSFFRLPPQSCFLVARTSWRNSMWTYYFLDVLQLWRLLVRRFRDRQFFVVDNAIATKIGGN